MDLYSAITGRRSVREYTGAAVEQAVIEKLIRAAVQAPSAVNAQPWSFTVVRDRNLLDRISREANAHMLVTMPADHQMTHLRASLVDPHFHIFHHAPALIVISGPAVGSWITEDCSMAAQNLMLAAHAEGLGTCWIGFAQAFLNTPSGRAIVGTPQSSCVVAPIIVGHPAATPAAVPRLEPRIHWLG